MSDTPKGYRCSLHKMPNVLVASIQSRLGLGNIPKEAILECGANPRPTPYGTAPPGKVLAVAEKIHEWARI